MTVEELPRIKDWLDGKDIFITGVTGFLGKVLLEKLIRCAPTINRIYVLIRSKRYDKTIQDRLNDLKKFHIFDIVNERQPNWFAKLTPIKGDCSEIKLGISDDDWNVLKENVSVIFHTAASVRFDDPLKRAILLNVRGTREMCQLALESKKLEVFVHVSTTYCNNHYKIVDEKLYPPLGDWKEDIRLAIEMDEQELNIVTKLFTHHQANTYTYTKGVAESLVKDMCDGKVPTVIIRPSIVLPTLDDPFPGWIDNYNGPTIILVVVGKGVSRVQLIDLNMIPDFIPVDTVIKMFIIGACWRAHKKNNVNNNIDVLNACSGKLFNGTYRDLMEHGTNFLKYHSLSKYELWYPTIIFTRTSFIFTILFYVLQLIPAIIIDGILTLLSKKRRLLNIQRKIYAVQISLKRFQLNQWTFYNEKMMEITRRINRSDEECFLVKDESIDIATYFKNTFFGGTKYLLNQEKNEKQNCKRKMYYVHNVTKYVIFVLLCWTIFNRLLLPLICNVIN